MSTKPPTRAELEKWLGAHRLVDGAWVWDPKKATMGTDVVPRLVIALVMLSRDIAEYEDVNVIKGDEEPVSSRLPTDQWARVYLPGEEAFHGVWPFE